MQTEVSEESLQDSRLSLHQELLALLDTISSQEASFPEKQCDTSQLSAFLQQHPTIASLYGTWYNNFPCFSLQSNIWNNDIRQYPLIIAIQEKKSTFLVQILLDAHFSPSYYIQYDSNSMILTSCLHVAVNTNNPALIDLLGNFLQQQKQQQSKSDSGENDTQKNESSAKNDNTVEVTLLLSSQPDDTPGTSPAAVRSGGSGGGSGDDGNRISDDDDDDDDDVNINTKGLQQSTEPSKTAIVEAQQLETRIEGVFEHLTHAKKLSRYLSDSITSLSTSTTQISSQYDQFYTLSLENYQKMYQIQHFLLRQQVAFVPFLPKGLWTNPQSSTSSSSSLSQQDQQQQQQQQPALSVASTPLHISYFLPIPTLPTDDTPSPTSPSPQSPSYSLSIHSKPNVSPQSEHFQLFSTVEYGFCPPELSHNHNNQLNDNVSQPHPFISTIIPSLITSCYESPYIFTLCRHLVIDRAIPSFLLPEIYTFFRKDYIERLSLQQTPTAALSHTVTTSTSTTTNTTSPRDANTTSTHTLPSQTQNATVQSPNPNSSQPISTILPQLSTMIKSPSSLTQSNMTIPPEIIDELSESSSFRLVDTPIQYLQTYATTYGACPSPHIAQHSQMLPFPSCLMDSILQFLTPEEIVNVMLVCRDWYHAVQQSRLLVYISRMFQQIRSKLTSSHSIAKTIQAMAYPFFPLDSFRSLCFTPEWHTCHPDLLSMFLFPSNHVHFDDHHHHRGGSGGGNANGSKSQRLHHPHHPHGNDSMTRDMHTSTDNHKNNLIKNHTTDNLAIATRQRSKSTVLTSLVHSVQQQQQQQQSTLSNLAKTKLSAATEKCFADASRGKSILTTLLSYIDTYFEHCIVKNTPSEHDSENEEEEEDEEEKQRIQQIDDEKNALLTISRIFIGYIHNLADDTTKKVRLPSNSFLETLFFLPQIDLLDQSIRSNNNQHQITHATKNMPVSPLFRRIVAYNTLLFSTFMDRFSAQPQLSQEAILKQVKLRSKSRSHPHFTITIKPHTDSSKIAQFHIDISSQEMTDAECAEEDQKYLLQQYEQHQQQLTGNTSNTNNHNNDSSPRSLCSLHPTADASQCRSLLDLHLHSLQVELSKMKLHEELSTLQDKKRHLSTLIQSFNTMQINIDHQNKELEHQRESDIFTVEFLREQEMKSRTIYLREHEHYTKRIISMENEMQQASNALKKLQERKTIAEKTIAELTVHIKVLSKELSNLQKDITLLHEYHMFLQQMGYQLDQLGVSMQTTMTTTTTTAAATAAGGGGSNIINTTVQSTTVDDSYNVNTAGKRTTSANFKKSQQPSQQQQQQQPSTSQRNSGMQRSYSDDMLPAPNTSQNTNSGQFASNPGSFEDDIVVHDDFIGI